MTPASEQALSNLRDMTTIQWYIIPLLAIVFYIYTNEVQKARQNKNWDALFAGVTLFGTDFLFETINGWIFHLTQYSALWTTPGGTALRTTVGWNIEIMFMFSLAGIIYYNTLSGVKGRRILGLSEPLFWAIVYAAFCVFVECLLNAGGLLVWEYAIWERTLTGVLPIFFAGYFPLFLSPMLVISLKTTFHKVIFIGSIYITAILMNVIALGLLNWQY